MLTTRATPLGALTRTVSGTGGLSPRARARLAGVFEALEGFPAAFGQVVVVGMVARAGAAAASSLGT